MLVDKKILTGGLVMIAIGIMLSVVLNDSVPIGEGGMTEEQKLEFLLEERENSDYTTLSGILFGVGFLLVLISFGARRKKKGGAKKTEKKPTT
jgi:preprotein translocase subunit SecG